MTVYQSKDIRNIGVIGHGDHGKTSLVAAMLHTAGVTNRLLRVDEGNTVTDFDEEEVSRKVSVSSALAHVDWKGVKINLIDTPGYNIFINDAKAALIAADCALTVVDAVAGVEVQTEKVWGYAADYGIPRLVFVNKLARERADFVGAVEQVQDVLGSGAVAVQWPIGLEKSFRGIIDLISKKAWEYTPDGDGKGREIPIPAELEAEVEEAREALLEAVAETDETLLNAYLEEMTLTDEQLMDGLRRAFAAGDLFPVLCGGGLHNIGVDRLMDFLVEEAPSPVVRGGVATTGGSVRKIADDEPLALYVFKTAADPFAGRVTYFRLVSGVLHTDEVVQNFTRSTSEKFARLSIPQGKEMQQVPELHAGDIGVVAKLHETLTGDSLGAKDSPIEFPKVEIPPPAISFAIEPKTRQDEDRLSAAVHKVLEEDLSLSFYRDERTGEFLLGGNGQQHLDVVVSKLAKRYNCEVSLKAPKIPYRETIRGHADAHGRHKKQTGGHGQFGDCKIRMDPLERGADFEFSDEIFGGAIPKTYIPAVEKGIREAAEHGYLAGYPVVDFKVTLYDGAFHDVDSSELAFKLAGRKAFRLGMEQAKPALLEPLMNVEVVAPMDFAGDLMGDLNQRRGRIQGMETKGQNQVIKAEAPMSEMLTYANDLTSMTQGRGSFSMEFSHYDYMPQQMAEKVIEAARRERGDADVDDE
ncbi:MAG: elongation factor G [Acidobacteria bacterium]|nr:elongation factor G [Acidobacteriota bacterium]